MSGVAILSNARLTLLPLVLAVFLLWRGRGWAAAVAVPVLAAVALAPWVIRNKVDVGCFAITTDARALWKANNLNTYATLAHGLLDRPGAGHPERQRRIPDQWMTPEEAGATSRQPRARSSTSTSARSRRTTSTSSSSSGSTIPGRRRSSPRQATWMLWNPRVGIEGAQESGVDSLRHWAEPLYAVPLFLLAIAGLFVVPVAVPRARPDLRPLRDRAAWVFAGTTRYRVPWDFVLALLAAAAIDRLIARWSTRRR